MKKGLIVGALVLLWASTMSLQAQDTPTNLVPLERALESYVAVFQKVAVAFTPATTCAQLYQDNLRVGDTDDAVTDGALYCREITKDGKYLINPGAIGDQDVINQGVQQAYDVFGFSFEGKPTQTYSHAITVCLKGRGKLLFLPIFAAPRPVEAPQLYLNGDYSCTRVGSPGTIALVSG